MTIPSLGPCHPHDHPTSHPQAAPHGAPQFCGSQFRLGADGGSLRGHGVGCHVYLVGSRALAVVGRLLAAATESGWVFMAG